MTARRRSFIVLLPLLFFLTVSGCQNVSVGTLFQDNEALVHAALVAGTGKFLDRHPQFASRTVQVVLTVRETLTIQEDVNLSALEALVRQEIRWERLTPQEVDLVNLFVYTVFAEAKKYLKDKEVVPELIRLEADKMLSWIEETARTRVIHNSKEEKS